MKFKVGDEVELIEDYLLLKAGTSFKVTLIKSNEWAFEGQSLVYGHSAEIGGIYEKRLKLRSSMDNLQVGDVLVYDADEITVLGLSGVLIATSKFYDKEQFGSWNLLKELKEAGWKLKTETTEPKELTVAQISEELGYDVKVVK